MIWKTVPADESATQTCGADQSFAFVASPDDGLDEMVAKLRTGPDWLRQVIQAAFDTLEVAKGDRPYIRAAEAFRLTIFFSERGFHSGSLAPDDDLGGGEKRAPA